MGGSDVAISVRGLTKTYKLGASNYRPTSLSEALLQRLSHPTRRPKREHFDALRDVAFDIPQGEAVGIVGRNGAGKSTLLKILTRVTAPTAGRVELNGRMGSLLEVGTGFHPELTGRENVFLAGALLGMSRAEIRRQFDAIVDFSGIEAFLDTPVKRYSSGMFVRLAFAVAAQLETELLAIDEALAVGDASFQEKSLAKMREAAKDGRTVLYVSHQLQTVSSLCTSALFLRHGQLIQHGAVEDVLANYRASLVEVDAAQAEADRRPGSGELRVTAVTVGAAAIEPAEVKRVVVELPASPALVGHYYVTCQIIDRDGDILVQCDSRNVGVWFDPAIAYRAELTLGSLWLRPGRYGVDVIVGQAAGTSIDVWRSAAVFEVVDVSPYPADAPPVARSRGKIFADYEYRVTAE